MNTLQERKHPLDRSADWAEQTVGQRLNNCIFQLSLFGIIDDQTAVGAFERLNAWIDAKCPEQSMNRLERKMSKTNSKFIKLTQTASDDYKGVHVWVSVEKIEAIEEEYGSQVCISNDYFFVKESAEEIFKRIGADYEQNT